MSETEERPVALVTGGGTGIGSACCRALAAEGFRVGVHYRSSEESASKVAASLEDAFTVQGDISDADQIDPQRILSWGPADQSQEYDCIILSYIMTPPRM